MHLAENGARLRMKNVAMQIRLIYIGGGARVWT
jgi:hypothetical protein